MLTPAGDSQNSWVKPAEQLENMVEVFSLPSLKQETGSGVSRAWVTVRLMFFLRRSMLSVSSAGCLSAFSLSSSGHSDISGVRGYLTLIHRNTNSAGFKDESFSAACYWHYKGPYKPHLETALSALRSHPPTVGEESCLILLDNTRKAVEIYESCGCVH